MMDINELRPIISGIIGGIVAILIGGFIAHRWPQHLYEKTKEVLIRENRSAIWFANISFFIGLIVAIAMYQWMGFEKNDWRPLCLGFGVALTTPALALSLATFLRGREQHQAFIAYALSQGIPLKLLYLLTAAGFPILLVGLVAIL
jgi:uncharacterized protein YacL